MNDCPPKPGLTLIIHTRSISLMVSSNNETFVCGFIATPAFIPSALIA